MKLIPEEAKESTIIGVVFSTLFTVIAALLFLNELTTLLSVKTSSELVIDHMKDDVDIIISIDIELPYYPCGMLSLDKMDVIHSHIVDVEENLTKFRLSKNGQQIGKFLWSKTQLVSEMDLTEKVNTVQEQISNGEGCRVVGTFAVKAVPGNFHISFHNYGDIFQYLMQRGLWQPDMSHKIKKLRFGGKSLENTKR
jgi:hypothetical protein